MNEEIGQRVIDMLEQVLQQQREMRTDILGIQSEQRAVKNLLRMGTGPSPSVSLPHMGMGHSSRSVTSDVGTTPGTAGTLGTLVPGSPPQAPSSGIPSKRVTFDNPSPPGIQQATHADSDDISVTFDEIDEMEEQWDRWVVLPDSTFKVVWNVIFVVSTLCQVLITLFSGVARFSLPVLPPFVALDVVFTLINIADILIHFVSARHSSTMNIVIDNLRQLTGMYLRSWFLFDLLITLPLDLIMLPFSLFWYRVFNCVRVLRVIRVSRSRFCPDPMKEYPRYLVILLSCFWGIITFHSITCGWMAMALYVEPDTNVPSTGTDHLPYVLLYSEAVYFVMTVFSTVGFGDISPLTVVGKYYVVFMQLFATVCNVFLLGYGLQVLTREGDVEAITRRKKRRLSGLMDFYEVPASVQKQAYVIYPHLLKASLMEFSNVIGELPSFLQQQIIVHVKRRLLSNVPMLVNASDQLVQHLADHLLEEYYPVDAEIFCRGDAGEAMYFLLQGMVEVLGYDPKVQRDTWLCHLEPGAFFGEISVVQETMRVVTVRAVTACVVYRLEKEDFARTLDKYPEFRQIVEATDTYKRRRSTVAPDAVRRKSSVLPVVSPANVAQQEDEAGLLGRPTVGRRRSSNTSRTKYNPALTLEVPEREVEPVHLMPNVPSLRRLSTVSSRSSMSEVVELRPPTGRSAARHLSVSRITWKTDAPQTGGTSTRTNQMSPGPASSFVFPNPAFPGTPVTPPPLSPGSCVVPFVPEYA